MELEFHISPARSSSRPQVSGGASASVLRIPATTPGSSLTRTGPPTASAMPGMLPSGQQRTSYRKA